MRRSLHRRDDTLPGEDCPQESAAFAPECPLVHRDMLPPIPSSGVFCPYRNRSKWCTYCVHYIHKMAFYYASLSKNYSAVEDHIGYGFLGLAEAKKKLGDRDCRLNIPYIKKYIKYAMLDGISHSYGKKKWLRNVTPMKTVSMENESTRLELERAQKNETPELEQNMAFEYDFKKFVDSLPEIERRVLLYSCLPGTLHDLAAELNITYNQLMYIRKMLKIKLSDWNRLYNNS